MKSTDFPFARPRADVDTDLDTALRGCAKQDLAALRRIYDLAAPRLLAELLQILGDPETAEAALEDCFIAIWQQSAGFNPQRSQPLLWLLSIVRRHAVAMLREAHEENPGEVDSSLRFLHATLDEEGVPPQLRLVHMVWRSGRSAAEIARALQWPLARVRQEIRCGLRALDGAAA